MCLRWKSTSSRRYRTEGKREDVKDLSLEAMDGAIESADRMTRIGSIPIHRNLMLNKSMVRCIDLVKPEEGYALGWPSERDAAPVARSRTLTGLDWQCGLGWRVHWICSRIRQLGLPRQHYKVICY